MTINGFHHTALTAENFDKTVEFYTKGLGFEVTNEWKMDDGNRAVMIDTGNDNYLEIFEGGEDEEKEGPYLHLAFCTQDCERAFNKAKNAGAKVTQKPQEIDIPSEPVLSVKVAFCKGPDGEVIEFFEEK